MMLKNSMTGKNISIYTYFTNYTILIKLFLQKTET